MKSKVIIGIISVIIIALAAILLYAGNYLVTYAMIVDENKYFKAMGSEPYTGIQDTQAQKDYDAWVQTQHLEELTIQSDDGLKLWAQVYPGAKDSHTYVLAVHGYTVDHRNLAPAIVPFVKKGWNVITPDQRARGNSEGDFVSMGYKEKDDVILWINKIIEMDKDAEIVLYGESMGAATVLMASGQNLPSNVKAVVEDCGYTSAYAMFEDQLKERFNLPAFPFLPIASQIAKFRKNVDFEDADVNKHLQNATLPILFIHGGADDYVPTFMGKELYENYKNEKELLIVEGAGHGESSDVDPDLYYSTIFKFLEKYGVK